MRKDLVIINSSNFALEVAWLTEQINMEHDEWNLLGFVDNENTGAMINGYPVIGSDEWLKAYSDPIYAVCAIGSPILRKRVISEISQNPNVRFPNLIAPDVKRSQLIEIGEGCMICSGTIMTVNIKIGSHVIINLDCTVGHGAIIEDFCTLSPSTNVSGNVIIKEGALIGTGVNIIEKRTIGARSIIGAGSVVTKDIENDSTAVGVPAKCIKHNSDS